MLGIRTRAKRMVGAGEKCLSVVPWVNVAKQSFKKWFQWFLVQVAERSLQTPEISCSNPVIGNFYFLSTVIKRQKLRRTHGPFKNCKFSTEGSTAYTPNFSPLLPMRICVPFYTCQMVNFPSPLTRTSTNNTTMKPSPR